MTNNPNTPSEKQVQEAVLKRAATGIASVSVDGMSTTYQSLDTQLKALQTLKKMEASKNPLAAIKIFKVKYMPNTTDKSGVSTV